MFVAVVFVCVCVWLILYFHLFVCVLRCVWVGRLSLCCVLCMCSCFVLCLPSLCVFVCVCFSLHFLVLLLFYCCYSVCALFVCFCVCLFAKLFCVVFNCCFYLSVPCVCVCSCCVFAFNHKVVCAF